MKITEIKTIKDILFNLDINTKQYKAIALTNYCNINDEATLEIDMKEKVYNIIDVNGNISEVFTFDEIDYIRNLEETYTNKGGITYNDLMEYMQLDDYAYNNLAISEIFSLQYDYNLDDMASPGTISRVYQLVREDREEKQELQDKLKEFKRVSSELAEVIQDIKGRDIENAFMVDYPFNKDFLELDYEIKEWVLSVSNELEKHL